MSPFRKSSANPTSGKYLDHRKYVKLSSWLLILFSLLSMTTISCGQAPGNQSDVEWLIDVLEIKEGSVVADIGAGNGDQTVAIAKHIGPDGQIYSTELGSESIEKLQDEIEESKLKNITVIEGDPNRTNLPEECCNAVYLRRVYHHIKNPAEFNASLLQSLEPGGRLAIIDFEPRGSEADPSGRASGNRHGVTTKTVIEELAQAGFELVSTEQPSGRDIYVVMKKPSADGDE